MPPRKYRAGRPGRRLPPPGKVYLIPVELFFEIFRLTIQADSCSRVNLMLVCRRWRHIMLSTPGINVQLRIQRSTEKKDVEAVTQGRSLLDVVVDMNNEKYGKRFNPRKFYACFVVIAQVASRWHSFELLSSPPHGEHKDLRIVQPLEHLTVLKLALGCSLGNFLEPFMFTIATTATPQLNTMEVADPDALLYLVQPVWLRISHSLTTLKIQLARKMVNHVDILPHLHQLETFHANHLCLPIYPPDTHLPLIQTLHILYLRCVSVQWMNGRLFPALQKCSIISPHDADTILSVNLPSCSLLKYESDSLAPLGHFNVLSLSRLEVRCGQWSSWRGNLQLVILHPTFSTAQSMTCLHLQVLCSETLLAHMLRLVPTLEELWLGLANPHMLSKAFFLAFVSGGTGVGAPSAPSNQTTRALCGGLKRLHLHYKRWLRALRKQQSSQPLVVL